MLHPDRFFDAAQREVARQLYVGAKHLPLICPHGHVDPRLFADPDYSFGSPVEMLIIPDHYVFRMLYSQGIRLEQLGIPRLDGTLVETDHRHIWQLFAEHFYLFRSTPTGIWLQAELEEVFGITEPLNGHTAAAIYNHLSAQLTRAEFKPRALFRRFNIEVLATTDPAESTLEHHQAMRKSGWPGRVIPTFRPDAVLDITRPEWRDHLHQLSQATGIDITSYKKLIQALEQQRAYFKSLGATATDHGLDQGNWGYTPNTAEKIFQQALKGTHSEETYYLFRGAMLREMARMSAEDGLVMQLHMGVHRNHHQALLAQFGRDKGADIPLQMDQLGQVLHGLLNEFGTHPNFHLILFTLDESTYSRELAPLAGHYPAVKIGPPWWFHDSLNGIRRYFDQVMETAGIYNTAGFNDDTRAFPSIPARHDVWRRSAANWLAGMVIRHIITEAEATEMMRDLAYGLAKRAYRLD